MHQQPSVLPNLDRRFWVLAALSLAPAVSTSFARFAYALILPAMRADLDLTYSQAGSLNTANALGYLIGALFCARYVPRFGNRRLFAFGMIVTVLSLIGAGLAVGFVEQVGFRALAGTTSAMVYICGAVLASNVFADRPDRSALAIGVYFGGAGAGIVLSGIGIPWLLAFAGDDAWRGAWLAIAVLSVPFAVVSIWASRRIVEPSRGGARSRWSISDFQGALASYFLFGAGYIAYMTFVVAWMVGRGASPLGVSLTWGTLGAATMLAPAVWRIPRARWRAARTLAAVAVVISIGAAIPLYSASLPAMVLSAFFFGTGMFAAPTTITDLIKGALPKAAWAPALAVFTVVFGVGQAIGPVLTGWIADTTHSLNASLAASVVILLCASGAALGQRETAVAPAPARSPQRASAITARG